MSERLDVVVIGAGAAGLAAAQSLAQGGCAFAVLEAQDRVGGRVHSVRLEDGRIYERGGQFFSRHMHELLGLAKQYGFHHRVIRSTQGGLAMINDRGRSFRTRVPSAPCLPGVCDGRTQCGGLDAGLDRQPCLPPVEHAMTISAAEEIWCGPLQDIRRTRP